MNRQLLLVSFVAVIGAAQFAVACDASSKKQNSAETSKPRAAPSQSKPTPVEPLAKRDDPVKWDQLDAKSLETRAAAQQTPFTKVPAER